jgi:flagellar biosynthesis repressor protein FlbT
MKSPIQISLKAGERIFINGAVVRVDSKVKLELLNDVTFLLEGHVMQPDETTTPLRQIYFVLQTILMDPRNGEATRTLFWELYDSTAQSFNNEAIADGLKLVASLVEASRTFEALRSTRALFAIEENILTPPVAEETDAEARRRPKRPPPTLPRRRSTTTRSCSSSSPS